MSQFEEPCHSGKAQEHARERNEQQRSTPFPIDIPVDRYSEKEIGKAETCMEISHLLVMVSVRVRAPRL